MLEDFLNTQFWVRLDDVSDLALNTLEEVLEFRHWAHGDRLNSEFTRRHRGDYILCINNKIYVSETGKEYNGVVLPTVSLEEFIAGCKEKIIEFKDIDIMTVFGETENA